VALGIDERVEKDSFIDEGIDFMEWMPIGIATMGTESSGIRAAQRYLA
jgi:hypothetical protein